MRCSPKAAQFAGWHHLRIDAHETGQVVQGWIADGHYLTACGRVYLINPKTGKVLEATKSRR